MGLVKDIARAVERSPKSRYRLARETGLHESTLCLLVQGKRKVRVATLERIADALDLQIVLVPKGKKGRKHGKHRK